VQSEEVYTSQRTAVLLFSRTALEEARAKSFGLGSGQDGNRAIARSLIRHSMGVAQASGLTVLTCFSHQQVGKSFGERLANAMEDVFAQGFERVIVIGNDCPSLTSGLIRQANADLISQEVVLGPAHDGGVYLIGMNRNAWNREQFLALPWQSAELNESWRSYSASIGELVPFHDLDHYEDLLRFIRLIPVGHQLRVLLMDLLGLRPKQYQYFTPHLHPASIQARFSLRAPPAC